ncbi:MAG: transketolase [bacterium]|nr:transketolase [bacterium]
MEILHEEKLKKLEVLANEIRQTIILTLAEAKSGHTAGPLGMADIFTAMYFHVLKHDPNNPDWPERDRLLLSNGHICPVLYVTMAFAGYFPKAELKTLRKINTRLQGHPHRQVLPGIESTSGPLGSGLSQTCGMALASRLDKKKNHFYCMMSDGECDSGNTWEGAMLAGKYKLSNITAIIDRNNIQIDGNTENIMPLEPFRDKWEAFGWHTIEVNGHNIEQFVDAVYEAQAIYEKPTVIIAHTIPGKGVSFMEGDYRWHGTPPGEGPENIVPKSEQAGRALEELQALGRKIQSEH